jgi:small subunit ribosomal protein S6
MEEQKNVAVRTKRPDRKGWHNEYETVFALPNDQTDEAADKTAERLRGIVTRDGGRVIKFTFWGRRKTAFDVKKSNRAIYLHMQYLGTGKIVDEVERNLRNSEEVVKFQTALVKRLVDPESRPTEADVRLAGDIDETRPVRAEGPAGVPGVPELEGVPDDADDVVPEVAGPEAAE